jgi:hypothetical protein
VGRVWGILYGKWGVLEPMFGVLGRFYIGNEGF